MALSPEQRAAAQKILDKETGADKRKEESAAKKERSEVRKEKELKLKQANLKIRQQREKRRGDVDKQRQDAKKKSEATKKAATHAAAAKTALKTKTQTITDKEGDATAAGKAAENVVRSTAGIAKSIYHRVKQRQAMKASQESPKPKKKMKPIADPWKEEFLYEVDDSDSKNGKLNKVIDVMRGKNKIEVNPKVQAEAASKTDPKQRQEKQLKRRLLMTKLRALSQGVDGIVTSYEPEGNVISEEDSYSQAKSELGKTKKARNQRYNTLHKATNAKSNIDVNEAKVDQGLDDEAKEDTRNYRKFGTKHNQAGTARFRRALHRLRRGDKKIKGQKVPADAYGEQVEVVLEREDSPYEKASDKALDKKYGYGTSHDKGPKTGFGRASNRNTAAAVLKDIRRRKSKSTSETRADAAHKGWSATAKTSKDQTPEKKETRKKLADTPYKKLPKDEQEKDKVAADAVKKEYDKRKKTNESVTIEDAKGKPFLEIIDIIKPEPMKSPKNNIQFEEDAKHGYDSKGRSLNPKDRKVSKVMNAVANERKRKNALQIQKTIGTQ